MSKLDLGLEIFDKLKLEHEKIDKELAYTLGQLEVYAGQEADAHGKMLLSLTKGLLIERSSRVSEDIVAFGFFLSVIRELVGEIDALRNLVTPLAIKEKSLDTQLKELDKRVKKRLGFDRRLNKFLKKWDDARKKTEEEMKKVGFYG